MQRLAVALLLGGVLLVATWVLAGDPPRHAPASEAAPRPDQVEQLVNDVNQQVELMRERLELERKFVSPRRNPFLFNAPVQAAPAVPLPVEPVVVPDPIVLPQLVAILTDKIEGGVARRAVLTASGTVHIVKVGESIDRFQVTGIDAEGVDLKRPDAPAAFRLTIK